MNEAVTSDAFCLQTLSREWRGHNVLSGGLVFFVMSFSVDVTTSLQQTAGAEMNRQEQRNSRPSCLPKASHHFICTHTYTQAEHNQQNPPLQTGNHTGRQVQVQTSSVHQNQELLRRSRVRTLQVSFAHHGSIVPPNSAAPPFFSLVSRPPRPEGACWRQ